MSNKKNVSPYNISSKKSRRDKLCRSVYALKKEKNLPIIVDFTPRELIPFLASIDVNFSNYIVNNTPKEHMHYWNSNLKQTFQRTITKKGCIRKLNEPDNLTLDTPLKHFPDQIDGNICNTFMSKIAQFSEKQLAGGMGSKIVTLSNYEVHDATIKMLRNVTELTNVTSGSKKYFKILADNLFKDEKELCVHGLHYIVRGQIYHKEYNTGSKSPKAITYKEIEYTWQYEKGSWILFYDYDYSNLGDMVRIAYVVGNGTIQVYMQEIQPGYCLNSDQLTNFYTHTITILNNSLLMEIPYELVEDVRYDINQDIPATFIHAYDPDLVDYLKYITPSGDINFPRYDFKNPKMKGSYFQIYLKKKLVNGKMVDIFRFEISLRSKISVNTMKHGAIKKFIQKTLFGYPGEFGGIISLHEDSKKVGGDGIRDAFDMQSTAPYMGMIDEFVEMRVGVENKLDKMDSNYKNQIGNVSHTTVVNSMVLHKLATEIHDFGNQVVKFQDYDLNGMVQQQMVLISQVEEMLQTPQGVSKDLLQLVVSNQETLQQFMESQSTTNLQTSDAVSQLTDDSALKTEILNQQTAQNEKVSEILSELKNNLLRREGDLVNFTTQYVIKNESSIDQSILPVIKEVEFVTHKKKLISMRVVNGIVFQEIISMFTMDPTWRTINGIRNTINRKEETVRNAVYLGLDARLLHKKSGKRSNSVLYNLFRGEKNK